MTTEQESLRPLTRDDTEHGVEYVRLSDVRKLVAEREADRAAMRRALEALNNLGTYDSRPSSIWRYFYPSATGDYVNLREVKEKIDPAITDLRQRLEGTT